MQNKQKQADIEKELRLKKLQALIPCINKTDKGICRVTNKTCRGFCYPEEAERGADFE